MSETINRVLLVGSVAKYDGEKSLLLETTQTTTKKTYVESHQVTLAKALKNIEEGTMLQIHGELRNAEEGGNHFIQATKVTKAPKDATSQNWAQVTGRLARTFEFYPRFESKQAFGNMLIITGDDNAPVFHRGVVFQYLANKFKNTMKRGAIVELVGRIRHRQFIDDNDIERTSLEIVGDDELTLIKEAAITVNPFAAFDSPKTAGSKAV